MILLAAKTSAIHHHLCLKSTESVAVARDHRDQAVHHEPHQTHHHSHQGGARGLHTAGVLQSLVPFSVHSRAFEQGPGEALRFIYRFVI